MTARSGRSRYIRIASALTRVAIGVIVATRFASAVAAQMTVSGRVTAGDHAVSGATVQIPDLRLETRTTTDGSFNILIPSSAIRGQRVRIVARDRRYGSRQLEIALEGRPLVVDFALAAPTAPRDSATAATTPSVATAFSRETSNDRRVDSVAFAGAAASLDLGSALAGRFPGLLVTVASTPGASAPLVFRGPRTLAGWTEPLVVVDGVPIDTRSFTRADRFGLGGFDYGTAIQDLSLDDIASVTLLDGMAAALRYGSRAANGVLLVTTKRAGNAGFEYSVHTRYVADALDRFPSFQNQFGQGLGGQFEFFDGAGGGINDDVAASWGPTLQGQPIVQASYMEARRPDVRPWVPHSLNVRKYFGDGGTFDATGAIGFGDDIAGRHLRASLNARRATGLTPGAALTRVGANVGGTAQMTSKLNVRGNAQLVRSASEQRPGVGFDEINPMSQLVQMGRQVNLDSLEAHIVENGEQINWIYTGFNNPFFQALRNTNADTRIHGIAGGTATYQLGRALGLAVNGAFDHTSHDRDFDVAPGWKGGYPTALGRADFSGGGSQRQTITSSSTLASAILSTTGRKVSGLQVDGEIGAELRAERFAVTTDLTDKPSSGAPLQSKDNRTTTNSVTSIHTSAQAARGALLVAGGVRAELPSALTASAGGSSVSRETSLFPMISATYDVSSLTRSLGLTSSRVRAGWWRAGNEVTARGLSDAYGGVDPAAVPTFGIAPDGLVSPEMTTGWSVGAETHTAARLGLTLTLYQERTSDAVLVTPDNVGNAVTSHGGEISNKGIEAMIDFVPVGGEHREWDITAWLAKNSNTVSAVGPAAVSPVALGPTFGGATLSAAAGSPVGVIVGSRFLRDESGLLLLRNGLPVSDARGSVVLGSIQPDWSGSIASRARLGSFELSMLGEARMGGRIFSATNRWGTLSGTLTQTLAGRDTGLVVVGIDSVSGQPNAMNVAAESYFRSLGGIAEAFVYDASFVKLRDTRLSYALPLRFMDALRDRTLRVSVIGRNLLAWRKAPNVDPESAISTGVFQGFEMGQLPGTRSLGFSVSIAP